MSSDPVLNSLTPLIDMLSEQVDHLRADSLGDTADPETKVQMGQLTSMLKSQLGNLKGLLRGILDDNGIPVELSGEPGYINPHTNPLMSSLYQRRRNDQMGRRGDGTYDPTDALLGSAPPRYIGVPGKNGGGVYDPSYITGP